MSSRKEKPADELQRLRLECKALRERVRILEEDLLDAEIETLQIVTERSNIHDECRRRR